jgi:uncharacterized protein with NAD-binding domain and iron-sulfur cluster
VSADRPRVAILGGGAGGVTAALGLSKGDWPERFSAITLYQQGWRLGGKGACGRGRDLRIEEHGLHLWFGFYENAFGLLERCHQELDARAEGPTAEARWPLPFTDMEHSFTALDELGVADYDGCDWKPWMARFSHDEDDRPWRRPDPRPPGERPEAWSVVFFVVRGLRLAADAAASLAATGAVPAIAPVAPPASLSRPADPGEAIEGLLALLGGEAPDVLDAAAELLDTLVAGAAHRRLMLDALDVVLRAFDEVLEFLRRRLDDDVRADDALRRAFYVVDLIVAFARGVLEDGVVEAGDFDVIDDVDLRLWLLTHGADRESVDCSLVRGLVYDLGFAYEGGDPQRPSCAAGTAVRGLVRAFFTYRGSLLWRMNAGLGDVVFLPFYELLSKRGVDVRFFHRVEEVRIAGGGVEELVIDVQADVPPTAGPRTFATSTTTATQSGDPEQTLAWPSDPWPILFEATQSGLAPLGTPAKTYESWYAARSDACVETKVLRRGHDDGFDLVVFGLPISCVPNVAPDLLADPRWLQAVRHVLTVPTQALQLWLDRTAWELAEAEDGTVVSGFVEPFDTWADMPQVVAQERVAGSRTVAYFCNVLPDTPAPPRGEADAWLDEQDALVRAQAVRFLTRDIGSLWPDAVDPITGALLWDLLVASPNRTGPDRIDDQYVRANVEPSERYVLSVPGSSRYRIAPGDTGLDNLYAAGDWTACGLNAGCVEAAVISGMLAANAIHRSHGDPGQVEPIIGLDGP